MPDRNAVKVIFILAFIGALGPFSIDAYLPALPAMAAGLGVTAGEVQWTVAAYLGGMALFPLALAPLSDAYGRLPVIRLGLAAYALVSVACAFVGSVEALIALRVAQAAFGGAAMTVARAYLADIYRGDALSRAMSYLMLVFTLAPVIAPLAGAQVLALGGWRWIFAALAGFGLSAIVASLGLAESLPQDARRPWRPATIIAGYVSAARSREAWIYLGSTFFSAFFFFAMLTASPFIFIDHFGVSPFGYGLFFAAISAVAFGANFLNARLVMRRSYPAMLRDAVILVGALALVMGAVAATGFGGVWAVFAVMVWLMGAFHVINANTTAGIMDTMRGRAGIASAMLAFWRFLGGAAGAGAVGAFGSSAPWGFAIILAVAAAGMSASVFAGRR